MDEVSKNILNTLIWFDIFDWPLSEREIHFFKKGDSDRQMTSQGLAHLLSTGAVYLENDLYSLRGRQEIIPQKEKSQKIASQKIKKAVRATKFISRIPFVRSVFVCNSLGLGLAKKEDDIDFFIITEQGKIWTTRFLVTGFFKLLNQRPNLKKNKIADKFCFSFYISDENLDLRQIKLSDDPYLENWILGLEPIFIRDSHILEKFINDNSWILAGKDDFRLKDKYLIENLRNKFSKQFFRAVTSLFSEQFFKKIQLKIMPHSLREKAEEGRGVLISDSILKFHLKDNRQHYADLYQQKLKTYYGSIENK